MPEKYLSEEYLQTIKQLYSEGDWRKLLELHGANGDEERALLWPKPEEQDLHFIEESVRSKDKESIVSIGCGTGLLEWFLHKATDFGVHGVEVDREYWSQPGIKSKLFIEAIYPDDEHFKDITSSGKNAIMFCYFNNGPAFLSYLENYKGNCVIVIGPHLAGRHTDPGPFDPIFQSSGWTLFRSKEIGNTKDYIAIYER